MTGAGKNISGLLVARGVLDDPAGAEVAVEGLQPGGHDLMG